MPPFYKTTVYRYPDETVIFWATVLLVLIGIAVTAAAGFGDPVAEE